MVDTLSPPWLSCHRRPLATKRVGLHPLHRVPRAGTEAP